MDHAARSGALFTHEEIRRDELLWRKLGRTRIRRENEDQFIAHEGLSFYSTLTRRTFDQANGNLASEEKVDDFFCVAAVNGKLNARMFSEKRADEPGKNILRDGGGDAEGEFTGRLSIGGNQILFGGGGEGGDFVRVTKESSALGRHGYAMAGTVEEAHTEIVFEGLDLESYGGLCEEEMLGCLAEVEVVRYGAEDLEAEIFELSHEGSGDEMSLQLAPREAKAE